MTVQMNYTNEIRNKNIYNLNKLAQYTYEILLYSYIL